jgi:hypothetical protein
MNVVIEFIPHNQQRYDTLGDWRFVQQGNKKVLLISISKMKDRRSELAVAVHELVESLLCAEANITPEMVDEWDFNYPKGEEPGDDIRAPYHVEHVIASRIEKEICHSTGLLLTEHELNCAQAESLAPQPAVAPQLAKGY